jgi:hypothetical protein
MAVDLIVAGVGVVGATILRSHVRMSFSSLSTDTNPGFQYGIIVVDKNLASVGNPNVLTDLDADWMIQSFVSPGTAITAFTQGSSVLYGETLDLKARRRLHEVNDRPFLIFRNNGSAAANYSYWAKQLYALP